MFVNASETPLKKHQNLCFYVLKIIKNPLAINTKTFCDLVFVIVFTPFL